MVDTPVNLNNTPTPVSKNRSLSCPECDQLWNRCQCSTKKIDVTDSLMDVVEAAASGEVEESQENFKGAIVAGKYEVIECLGEGGMGGVFLTEHVSLKKKFALKILRKGLVEDEFLVERLRREAQACAMLAHPNIVSVFDFGVTDNGFPFIVMEYLEGKDLSSIIDQKSKIDLNRVIRLVIQICNGLGFAHEKGVIHRDLKPTNVIVTNPDTTYESVKVVDFGIAKMDLPGGEMQHLTQTGEVLGSPAYMSPEQIQGEKIDGRSDIYSLGCILYELLTGKQLFRGHTMFATLEANLHQEPPKLEVDSDDDPLKKPLFDLMYRCLDKNRETRIQSLFELKENLEQIASSFEEKKTRKLLPNIFPAILAGVAFLLVLYVVQKKPEHLPSVSGKHKSSETKVVSVYEDVFNARLHDMASSNSVAKARWMKVFNTSHDPNARLAAAVEFINQRRGEFNYVPAHEINRIIEDIGSVKTRSVRIINETLEKDKGALDKNIAAHVLFEYANAMESIAAHYKGEYRSKHKRRMPTKEIIERSHQVKNSFNQIIAAYKKGIQLIEMDSKGGLLLASFYAGLGENQDEIGDYEAAIRSFEHAFKLNDESTAKCDTSALIRWHCRLAGAYIDTNQLEMAKQQYKLAAGLYYKRLSSSTKEHIVRLEKKLKEAIKKAD